MPPPRFLLRIPVPCSEGWDAMLPAGAGRHCAACAKTVVDFTQQTDAQILAYFRRAGARQTCGRLRAGQLGRPLQPTEMASRWRSWLGALLAASGVAATATSRAAAQVATAQHPAAPGAAEAAVPKPAASLTKAVAPQPADTLVELRGVVLDAERCEPLPGVMVVLKHSARGTTTNAEGEFSLRLNPTEQPAHLVFSSVGFVGQEQLMVFRDATTSRRMEVALDSQVTGGLLVSYGPPWPWHARAFYTWGKYWLTRPFR